MRVLGDAAQRGQVAVILRVVDRGGQLVISLLLLWLMREAAGVKPLHQLPPELAHLGGFSVCSSFFSCRRLRKFSLMLRSPFLRTGRRAGIRQSRRVSIEITTLPPVAPFFR